jgi:large subunit ribosomal protein L9
LAKLATPEVLAQHAEQKRIEAENLAKEIASLKELANKLDKCEIVITKKLGSNGHLFGSITKDEIAHALLEQHGIEIDKKHINEKLSIKSVGEHDVDFKLGHGLHATLHVDVVGE